MLHTQSGSQTFDATESPIVKDMLRFLQLQHVNEPHVAMLWNEQIARYHGLGVVVLIRALLDNACVYWQNASRSEYKYTWTIAYRSSDDQRTCHLPACFWEQG